MLTFRLSLLFTLVFSCVVLAQASVGWAQRRHDHSHRPPHGAAHDHRFNDIDQAVKMFESAERDTWQKPEEVMKHLQLRAGDVVADIGAGTGYFTRRFATAVGPQGKAIGLDIETTMVTHINNEAKKHGVANLTARQVPPNDPQLAPQSVDVVFICDTYHHMQDRVAYARLLATALKPGGRIVIIDFYKRELPIGPPVEWKLTPEAVTEEFRQAGFQPLRAVDFLPYQYFLEFTQASSSNARVTPGINHAFLDPALDVQRWTANFEGESREIFAQRRAITEALQLKPGMAVADIGAGTGVFLELFAQAIGPQGKLYATDIAPKFIDHLRHRATTAGLTQVSAILGHEQRVPLSESTIDLAFVCDTYHHFEYPQEMLTSIHRALRPGGTLVVIDFERIPEQSRPWVLEHLRADKATFTKEIVAAGFRLAEEVTMPGFKENYFLRFTKL
jgi:ubiquinone/menaquinone biosynthesis C-methylase UbiE